MTLILLLLLQEAADAEFFPIAVWLQQPRHAEAYKAAGINTYVGLWQGPTDAQLDALKAAGMKLVCHQNARALARRNDPMILAWMHGDEPDNAQPKQGGGYGPPILPSKIVEDYAKLKAADARPVLLNLGQGVAWDGWIGRGTRTNKPEDYPEYLKGCDIASFDIYPAVHDHAAVAGKLEFVAKGVERLRKWSDGKKPVWNCVEASRIDNEKTKPTPAQIRSEVWMSIIHGSTGIIYFVHQFRPTFVEASLLQDAELLKAVTEINREVRELAPVIKSPAAEAPAVKSAAPVAVTARRHKDATYLFACAMSATATRASFSVKGASVDVLGESRTLKIENGAFEDAFGPYEARLYRIH